MTQLEGIRALLAATGLVAPDAFDRVVAGRPGVLGALVTAGLVTWPALVDALAEGFSLPRVMPGLLRAKPMLVELVPFDVASAHGILPAIFRTRDGEPSTLWIALADPTDSAALEACAHGGAVRVRPMLAYPKDIVAALPAFYGRAPAPAPRPPVPPRASMSPPHAPDTDREVELADDDVEETPASVPPVAPVSPSLPPVLLVVGGDAPFTAAAGRAASEVGLECVSADLFAAASLARSLCPSGILVGDDAYAFDRVAFHRLAAEVGATLIVWDDLLDADEVLPVLALIARRAPAVDGAQTTQVHATAE